MKRTNTITILLALAAILAMAGTAEAQWTPLNVKAHDLAAGGGALWLVNMDRSICYSTSTAWVPYGSGRLFNLIEVAPDGTPWAVDINWKVCQGSGSGWYERGDGTFISIDPRGVVWTRVSYNYILRFDGIKFVRTEHIGQGATANAAGEVYLLGNGMSLHYRGRIIFDDPAGVSDFDLDAQGLPWVVGRNKLVYRWNGSGWTRLPDVPGGATRITIDGANNAFVVGGDNMVYMLASGSTGGGGGGGGGQITAQNRAPAAPTLLGPPNTWQPSVITNPGQRVPSVTLTWRHNGDPDGDPLKSWLNVLIWNQSTQSWQNIIAQEVAGTSFTLTFQNGLREQGYYMWAVASLEANGQQPLFTYAPMQCFHATLALE